MLLLVAEDLTALSKVSSQQNQRSSAFGDGSESSKASSGSELFLGERVFFWNIPKQTAVIISSIHLATLLGATVYITLFFNQKSQSATLQQEF